MADNVFVSFDEEKLMNDILDQGIDELKKPNPHNKSDSLNKSNIDNLEYNNKSNLIANNKLSNYNQNVNGSNQSNINREYNSKDLYENKCESN